VFVFLRYMFQMRNQQTGFSDSKAKFVYYANLVFKFVILGIDLGFHFHMIVSQTI